MGKLKPRGSRRAYLYTVRFFGGAETSAVGHETSINSTGVLDVLLWQDEEARYEDSVVFTAAPGQWKFVRRVRTAVLDESLYKDS